MAHFLFRGVGVVLVGTIVLLFFLSSIRASPDPDIDVDYQNQSIQRHIPFLGKGKSKWNGCRQKPVENHHLLGSAKACTSSKPLKLTKVLKLGKTICANDWAICSVNDKAVRKLSWKLSKMPNGCFAFNYGKAKAAGYGNKCHANLYFDGVLCCPVPGTKAHRHQKASTPYFYKNEKLSHRLNLVD